jgi:6-phosphofructokinase 1
MHPAFYDATMLRPSKTGIEYLLPIFTTAIGHDDTEAIRQSVFDSGNLVRPYHSVNTDLAKRIKFLESL